MDQQQAIHVLARASSLRARIKRLSELILSGKVSEARRSEMIIWRADLEQELDGLKGCRRQAMKVLGGY